MKKITINKLLFFLCLMLFSLETKAQKEDYFEGEIHYDLTYKSNFPEVMSEDDIQNRSGAKVVMLFKNGNEIKRFYDTKGKLLYTRILNLEEEASYQISEVNDTISKLDITKNSSPTKFSFNGNTKFLDQDCHLVTSVTQIDYAGLNFEAKAEYYIAKNLKTNKDWYKNYNEANFKDLASKTNCITLRAISDLYYYYKFKTATKIIHRKVGEEEFEFDFSDRPIKEI
ncbi:hypothetical protein [Aureivirga sp. CE67]|uniref:hypothetical protein n=1 Tax=Aureivirga sp. CE67 TaxID=1788983 RepID=UPI0018C9698A|nr:hypothetical protein [Aureivirga sp. CE67]